MNDWQHAPVHRLGSAGAYMITAATYRKAALFRSKVHLDLLRARLFALAKEYEAALEAWAIFPNHYHIMVQPTEAGKIRSFVRHLHSITSREINLLDDAEGRRVWFQYWDSHITFERSYFARLHYVHANAVHHGIVRHASEYPWCSAGWFHKQVKPASRKTILSFPIDRISVRDNFRVSREDFVDK